MNETTKVDFEFKLVSNTGLTPKVTSNSLSKGSSGLTELNRTCASSFCELKKMCLEMF